LSLVPWWGQYRFSPCCRSRRTEPWMCFLPYSFFVCKVITQRVRPWYANLCHKLPNTTRCVKNHHSAGNDLETVLLHKSAFLYVTSIFRLSSFVFANALLTGITKTFVPFYSSFPEICSIFARF
jgi:hypothetical protein